MTSWTGSRIQALSLHRKVGSDGWLPTRGLMSRENFPFFMLYAWALQKVSLDASSFAITLVQHQCLPMNEGRSTTAVVERKSLWSFGLFWLLLHVDVAMRGPL